LARIVLAVIVAVLMFTYGLVSGLNASMVEALRGVRELREALERFGIEFKPFSITTALVIFANNVFKSLLSIVLGVTVVVPLLMLYVNGYIIGLLFRALPLWRVLIGILPHGILELPAFIASTALGLNIGFTLIAKLALKRDYSIRREYRYALGKFKVIAVLLFIAAFIETYVTPLVVPYTSS